ncbi:hypothetical protein HanIR_Chr12g0585331 [Helianthus annuus]|nr:hypothetical protein HanIR_Chr12g0585331 [Helianthus annuus]
MCTVRGKLVKAIKCFFPMNPKAVNASSVSPRSSPFSSIPARYFRSQVSINNNPLTRRYVVLHGSLNRADLSYHHSSLTRTVPQVSTTPLLAG